MNKIGKKLLTILAVITFSTFSLFADSEITTITIKNARQTTYTKDKETENDLINLEGSVEISVKKGSTESEIKADKVTYDRKSEMLYADGNVEITTKSGSSGGETTRASTLLMNTATLEGVFDDGRVVQTQSDAINLPSGSTLVVFADIFGKSEKNVIAFKNSSLTFCDDENPHWRIDASRTWLLPGGEFAFFNALLYVGELPILYFPAFYYPKDELIFNPVFGYATRTGISIQTTTYLYGRKPLASTSSSTSSDSAAEESLMALYNFMKPGALKEQVREGLVLHNLDTSYTGDTTNYVKVMADWYSNLGILGGVDGKLSPAPDYISNLSFNAYAGLSNTIFKDEEGKYISYSPDTGKTYYDASSFLGLPLPFRYSGNLQFGLAKPFKITLALPIYSDPYFSNDYLNSRQESMDWISYFLNNNKKDDDTSVNISEVSSFSWTLTSSYSFVIPDLLKQFVSSASFSTNSSVAFSTKAATFTGSKRNEETGMTETVNYYDTDKYEALWTQYTPNKKFYYPSQIIPATVNLSVSGTIFQYPRVATTKSSTPSYTVALNQPDEIKSESQIKKEKEEAEKAAEEEAKRKAEEERAKAIENGEELPEEEETEEITEVVEEKKEEVAEVIEPTFPELTHSSSLKSLNQGINYKLTYTVTPNVTTQIAYSAAKLNQSEDFDWSNIRSFMYTAKIPAALQSNLTYGSSFLSMSNKVSYDPVFQGHPYVLTYEKEDNGGYTLDAAKNLTLADYKAESRTVSNVNTLSFNPFINSQFFSDTGLSWNSTIKLFRREFTGDADNVEWETHGLDFEDENCITVNSVNMTLGAAELEKKFKQTLTLSTVLPPQLKSYTASLNLTFPYVTASFGAGYSEVTKEEVEQKDKWKKNPLTQSLSVSLLDSKIKLSESATYNIQDEINHWDSFKTSASWNGLSLAYVMSYTNAYRFDEDTGWEPEEDKTFVPYSLSFSYSPSTKTFYKWFNRITFAPGLSTSIVADLLRPTNSSFLFNPNITFKINEFFNISFSSSSKNSILYWYFKEGIYDDGLFGIKAFPFNMLLDLVNSFRFDNEDLRKGSGFKLKSLNVTMSHQLHDWAFNMTCTVSPKIVNKTGEDGKINRVYDVTPTISIGIVWNPMSSIKSNLVYEYKDKEEKGVWSLEQ